MSDIFSAAASLPAIAGTMLPATFGPLIGDAGAPPYALISPTVPFRNIGGIFPDVTTEEIHRDELQITQHPVETGAPVTDHCFYAAVDGRDSLRMVEQFRAKRGLRSDGV